MWAEILLYNFVWLYLLCKTSNQQYLRWMDVHTYYHVITPSYSILCTWRNLSRLIFPSFSTKRFVFILKFWLNWIDYFENPCGLNLCSRNTMIPKWADVWYNITQCISLLLRCRANEYPYYFPLKERTNKELHHIIIILPTYSSFQLLCLDT